MPRRRRSRARRPVTKRRGDRRLRIEPLERRELLAVDYGDAIGYDPSEFNRAQHEAVGPMLGALRDANAQLVANSLANGDAQDEDGVAFGYLRSGQAASMTVYVTNAPADARLDAWIDFNRDTNFTTAGDQIADNLAVTVGDNVITFNIPATVTGGYYYARVRLSTAGNLSPTSAASDGEVEDYLIPIAHADSGPFAGQQPVSFNDATQAIPTDLDSDGDLDLLTSRLTWIENINGQYGSEFQIATTASTSLAVAPADVDGDGDMDVVVSGSSWYENNGAQSFTLRTIDSGSSGGPATPVDLDQDGDLDVIVAGGSVAWYRNNGSQSFTKIVLPSAIRANRLISAIDMDGDSDLDLLTASSASPATLTWQENYGNETFTTRPIASVGSGIRTAVAGDMDGDGDLDVVTATAAMGGVTWHENDGAFAFTAHALDAAIGQPEAATIADLDGDGDLDIAASGLGRVGWYENDGDDTFSLHLVAAPFGTHVGISAGDLDGDGRLDLVTAGTGVAPIAWYRQIAEYDYGDAPHPYVVHLQKNGARHNAVGPTLGSLRDAEVDGAHSPAGAEAEDDGVAFGALEIGQGFGLVTVNVQNAPAGARLEAWIDFNGDGTWAGAEEQIFTNLAIAEGDNALAFAIPSWAVPGPTYARFRLSTAGGLGVHGAALDGEVEDHAITLLPRDAATGLFTDPITIAATGSREHFAAADVDGDGDVDVITKGINRNLVWFENLGEAGFVTHAIPNSQVGVEDFAVGDLDGDGDVDFVSYVSGGFIWIENDGQQNFARHFQAIAPSIQIPISTPVAYAIADIDADGDCDVIVADLGKGVFALLNDGQQQFTPRAIDMSMGSTSNSSTTVAVADVDRDGDLDIVAGGARSSTFPNTSANVVWYQNNGALSFTPHVIKTRRSPQQPYTESVAVGDIDGDGDLDVVSGGTPGSTGPTGTAPIVTWHEQVADNQWVQHDLDTGGWLRWVELADFDADGDLDIVATGWETPTVLYENASAGRFMRRPLTPANTGGWSVAVADMDRDGDLDIVSPRAQGGPPIVWFKNIDLIDPDYGDAPGPYPTLRADSGPVHNGGGPRLGATRDSETDGAPTAAADGDAGDDGVTLPAVQVGDASGPLIVNVQNAPAGAKLDAWIDFNRDGSFAGADEQIFASRTVAEGDNALSFNIPANTPAGAVVARFRLSTAGGLRPLGAAIDGEVEDYQLLIAPPGDATAEYGARRTLDRVANSIRVADIDGDGDADFLTAGADYPYLLWHENLGEGVFLTHRRGLENAVNGGARPIDFDRDGDLDFVVTTGNGLGWYENNGAQSFTYRSNTGSVTGLRSVFDVADVDSDGDLDVIVSRNTSSTSQIYLLRNNGAQGFSSGAPLTTPTREPAAIRAADVDGDGDIDFAVTFAVDGAGWYENQGSSWTFRELTNQTEQDRAGRDIVPIDFDQDGDIDLIVQAVVQSSLVLDLYRNDGSQSFTRETLASTQGLLELNWVPRGGDRLQVADLDGDGDLDSAAIGYSGVRAYRNDGPGPLATLTATAPASNLFSTAIAVADLDGDGRLEIIASQELSSGTFWLDDLSFGDYNRDGTVDQADRDLYEASLGQTATPPGSGADGDRSGVVDEADLAIWEANQGRGPLPFYRPADFDQNESINGNDFLRWQQRVGTTSPSHEDVDNSGAVDGGDLAVWTRHYGQGVPRAILPPISPTAESAESSTVETAAFMLAANVFLEAPAPVAVEEEPVVDLNIATDAAAFDAALRSMNHSLLAPTVNPASVMPAARSQKARRVPAALADKLLGELSEFGPNS